MTYQRRRFNLAEPIAIISPKTTGLIVARGLARAGFTIGAVVTLDRDRGARTGNSAGVEAMHVAASEVGAPLFAVDDYAAPDLSAAGAAASVAICIGWQRIIPDEALDAFDLGVLGVHGSFKPLPHGRGRSPLNWALLLGRHTFFAHLFRYVAEVDAGPIYATRTFELNDFDDEFSATRKFACATVDMAADILPAYLIGVADPIQVPPAPEDLDSFYPKRTNVDGEINWMWSTPDILNHIRSHAATFSLTVGTREQVTIERAQPWELHHGQPPGRIVEVFSEREFVVATGSGAILVRSASLTPNERPLEAGDQFEHAGAAANRQANVPW